MMAVDTASAAQRTQSSPMAAPALSQQIPSLGQQDPLSELRDIHLPAPVSDWPVAPGWWVLFALLAAALAAAFVSAMRRWRSGRYRRHAIDELERLFRRSARNRDDRAYVAGCAEILKRAAMAGFPREEIASLSGEPWVAFLDRTYGRDGFAVGPGQVLIEGPYQRNLAVDIESLHREATAWIKGHRASRRGHDKQAGTRLPTSWLRRRALAR